MGVDDRLARLLYENNFLEREKKLEADVALLQKLATNASVVLEEPPTPGETEPPASNALNWQNVFLKDEFIPLGTFTTSAPSPNYRMSGQLGWLSVDTETKIDLIPYSVGSHYGILFLTNTGSSTDGYMALPAILSPSLKFMQYITYFEPMVDTNDGIILGLLYIGTFTVDGTEKGIYFKCQQTDTNWQAVTTDGVGSTITDTGVPFVDTTWQMFEIKQPSAGTIEFYITQILVATHTTNIDTTDQLLPIFGMQDTDAVEAFNIVLDYFAMQLAPIIQRWD